ncbi:hypothetical protein PTSG_06334 [Salpingoeca rosetta]|uniref:Protoporphyrinogen oxidase n=1 Tax=Salpingoeca rosetta (strain ATCC 50818 / BSB-021) TaxID=946362 RepID=F2UCL7_SALR5|nr:uncharacterized protein PTSG_06334 [Salpingoeca rosetta]EGD74324.1 hypothetical protein PTSG_06334 [Salpingoeca rosetta]|eukprot:XP_004993224.1 hypothetical protein PTSG_06334 [Salpingoeca rosetta]
MPATGAAQRKGPTSAGRVLALAAAGGTATTLALLYLWVQQRKRKARDYQQRVKTAAAFRRHIHHKHHHRSSKRKGKKRSQQNKHNKKKTYASVASGDEAEDDEDTEGQEKGKRGGDAAASSSSQKGDDDGDDGDDDDDDKEEEGPRIAVLGAGISGLAAAYYIKKKRPEFDVHVFEKDDVVGGNIQTVQAVQPSTPVRIETGPRSLRTSTASARFALQLIDELGLGPQLEWANRATRGRRFVFDEDTAALEELPTSVSQILGFAYRHSLVPAVLRDLTQALFHRDEGVGYDTCEAFFTKHFSRHLATRFLTALVHGIFSGEANKLLLRYAFPSMWQLEQAYGSVVLGAILDRFLKLSAAYETPIMPPAPQVPDRVERWLQRAAKERVASLKGGLTTLTSALWEHVVEAGVHMHMGAAVARMARSADTDSDNDGHHHGAGDDGDDGRDDGDESGGRVGDGASSGGTGVALLDEDGAPMLVDVDCVISTLPPAELHQLLASSLPHLSLTETAHRRAMACANKLARVRSLSIAVVTFVFLRSSFKAVVKEGVEPGFGFLMPRTQARGHLLGVVYDSCVFPELAGAEHVVLTAMLGGEGHNHQTFVETSSEQVLLDEAWQCVQQHLGVAVTPSASRLTRWVRAIPQFDHLYAAARADMEACVQAHLPWLFVGGKAFGFGVGVNDCIVTSASIANQIVDLLS